MIQTLSVAQQGATGAAGANAVVLTVYAPNGSTFTNQSGSLLLAAIGYSGANQITTGATYVWRKYNAGSWDVISGQTGSTLTVSGADVIGLQAYKCEMTYGGVVYSGTGHADRQDRQLPGDHRIHGRRTCFATASEHPAWPAAFGKMGRRSTC